VKSESYHQARNNAVRDLAEAVNQLKLLEQRIARLKQTIASLDALIEGEEPICTETKPDTQISLREACREALKIANGPRTATEVRDWLANSGYELSEQENALASIHTVLKRFVKAGEAAAGTNANGKTTYEWIGERGDAFTTAVLQANYQAAKQVTDMVRQALAGGEVQRQINETIHRGNAQIAAHVARAQQQQALIDKQSEFVAKVDEINSRAAKAQKLLDRGSKKS